MATNTDWLELNEQGSTPSTPDTSKWRVYAKSDGLYIVDDAGTRRGRSVRSGTTRAGASVTDTSGGTAHDDVLR